MNLQSIQRISLDTVRNAYRTVSVKAGDVATRFIHIQITDAGATFKIEQDNIVRAKITTPDNRKLSLLSYDTDAAPKHINILDDGTVLVQLSTGTLLKEGEAKAELEIKESTGDSRLSTFTFKIIIAEQVYDDDELLDDSEAKSAIAQLIAELNRYVDEAKDIYKEAIDFGNIAGQVAQKAKESEINAAASESNAKTYKDDAKISEQKAKLSENNSKVSENNAKVSEDNAKSWAVGDNENYTRTDGHDNTDQSSQFYANKAQSLVDEATSIYNEAKKQVANANFWINFETGELEYDSDVYNFRINDNGELEWEVE